MIKTRLLRTNLIYNNKFMIDVINCLNKSNEKICIVQNSKNKVCGIFTDGDIRRISINKKNFELKISKLYKKKFVFLKEKSSLADAKKIFLKKKDIRYIPVLKKNNKLLGIYSREHILSEKEYENEVLILAGGMGKRLHTLTDFFPKPMINVGTRPLLESILYSLKSSGFKNINISVNYLQEKIKNYFGNGDSLKLNINYFSEKKRLGTAGPLYFLKKKKTRKSILVLNGDIYTNLRKENLLGFHQKNKNDFTVCCHPYIHQVPYGVVDLSKKSKILINEKPKIKYLVNSGIYCFEPKLLKFLANNKYQDMNDFINLLKKKKKKIGFFNIHENLYDIGDYNKLVEARESE